MKKLVAVIVVAFVVVACSLLAAMMHESTMYAASNVEVSAIAVSDNGLQLYFQPPDESGYFCPGVRIRREGSVIHYEYARSRIGRNVLVDIPIENDDMDGYLRVTFPYPNGKWAPGEHIELIDSNGKSQ